MTRSGKEKEKGEKETRKRGEKKKEKMRLLWFIPIDPFVSPKNVTKCVTSIKDISCVYFSRSDIIGGIKWLTEKEPPNIHQLHSRVISECVWQCGLTLDISKHFSRIFHAFTDFYPATSKKKKKKDKRYRDQLISGMQPALPLLRFVKSSILLKVWLDRSILNR